MKLLALDPGNIRTAWLVYDTSTREVIDHNLEPNEQVLTRVLGHEFSPDHLAVEMVACYGMAVGVEVFETVLWIGRYIQAWGQGHTKFYRKAIKLKLCGSSKAKDGNVRQAIIDRFGGDSVAVGGVRCKRCKGKGWTGRQHARCEPCGGEGWESKPGPLHGIAGDCWSALAVALTFADLKAGAEE